MARITLFCLRELRHRVDLLADMLDQNGIAVEVLSQTESRISDPTLIVCNAEALQTPWVQAIFEREVRVAALLFENVAVPESCAHVVDLCAWPARSADRNLIDLISWLNRSPVVSAPLPQDKVVPTAESRGSNYNKGRRWLRIVGSGVTVIALMGLLMWAADSGRGTAEKKLSEQSVVVLDAETAELLPGEPLGVAVPPQRKLVVKGGSSQSSGVGRQPETGYREQDLVTQDQATDTVTVGGRTTAILAPTPVPIPANHHDSAHVIASPGNDSLSRFCRARDLASATAWFGTFTWKHRQQLEQVVCVQSLLDRPGFETLRRHL